MCEAPRKEGARSPERPAQPGRGPRGKASERRPGTTDPRGRPRRGGEAPGGRQQPQGALTVSPERRARPPKVAEEGPARALPSRPREQPLDPNKPAKGHQGGARGPNPGTRKGGGAGVRSPRSYSSEGGGGGHGAGSGAIGRLTCSSRCSRSLRGQHGASASSRSSRGAKRAGPGRERTRPWRRETGVAWARTETSEDGHAKPRESENTECWQGSTEAQLAPSRLGRESARGKIPPPPDASARALESDSRSGIPGAAHWEQRSLGNCSPSFSGYPPAVPVWRTHPGRGGSGREGLGLLRLFDD